MGALEKLEEKLERANRRASSIKAAGEEQFMGVVASGVRGATAFALGYAEAKDYSMTVGPLETEDIVAIAGFGASLAFDDDAARLAGAVGDGAFSVRAYKKGKEIGA